MRLNASPSWIYSDVITYIVEKEANGRFIGAPTHNDVMAGQAFTSPKKPSDTVLITDR